MSDYLSARKDLQGQELPTLTLQSQSTAPSQLLLVRILTFVAISQKQHKYVSLEQA